VDLASLSIGEDVTVCVLSYNRPDYLLEAVRSVTTQTAPPREIVILDNGSGPEVRDALAPFIDREVRWVGAEVNHSAFWNLRRAFRCGSGSLLYIMHDDDRLHPDFIEAQAAALQRREDCAAIGCNVLRMDGGGQAAAPLYGDEVDGGIVWLEGAPAVAGRYASGRTVPFPSIIYRREAAVQVDFREDEFGKVADVVFLCDLAERGAIGFNRTPLMDYRIHPGQDSSRIDDVLLARLEDELLRRTSSSAHGRQAARDVAARRTARRMAIAENLMRRGSVTEAARVLGRTLGSGGASLRGGAAYGMGVLWRARRVVGKK
jgi:glycosyltransferase involved in cell wall biosynthesis